MQVRIWFLIGSLINGSCSALVAEDLLSRENTMEINKLVAGEVQKPKDTPDQKLEALLDTLLNFYRKRDWEQFHSPKNLVMALASETGELVEPFRWLTEQQSCELDEATLQAVKDEIADVFTIIIYLSHKLGIDPIEATYQKLEKMSQKYPIDASRGKIHKYTTYDR
jgi:dCTP diphosphatase